MVCLQDVRVSVFPSCDLCGLFLAAKPTKVPVGYTSRVARLEPSKIGLQFMGMTFRQAAHFAQKAFKFLR